MQFVFVFKWYLMLRLEYSQQKNEMPRQYPNERAREGARERERQGQRQREKKEFFRAQKQLLHIKLLSMRSFHKSNVLANGWVHAKMTEFVFAWMRTHHIGHRINGQLNLNAARNVTSSTVINSMQQQNQDEPRQRSKDTTATIKEVVFIWIFADCALPIAITADDRFSFFVFSFDSSVSSLSNAFVRVSNVFSSISQLCATKVRWARVPHSLERHFKLRINGWNGNSDWKSVTWTLAKI